MPRNFKSFKIIAIAAVSSFAVIGAAQAGDHASFSYKESELQSTATINNLYKRIESRAQNACGADDARALYAQKSVAECEASLVDDWVAGINDPRLNRMHAQNGGSQIASVK